MLLRWRIALAGILVFAASAHAQVPRETRGASAGQFDFYVLALSWQPGFCDAGGAKGRERCEPNHRRRGFVVHGLWPQNVEGYPAYCEPSGRYPSRSALQEAQGLFPDEGLARHEWRRHGSCTGLSPAQYFRSVRRALDLVRIPDRLEQPAHDSKVLASDIERAFMRTNPGLRLDMMAVGCERRIFQEIRICLDKDLRGFRSCPEVDRSGCRAGAITVPAAR